MEINGSSTEELNGHFRTNVHDLMVQEKNENYWGDESEQMEEENRKYRKSNNWKIQ